MHLFSGNVFCVIWLTRAIFPSVLCETVLEGGARRDSWILVEMVAYKSLLGAGWMSDVIFGKVFKVRGGKFGWGVVSRNDKSSFAIPPQMNT